MYVTWFALKFISNCCVLLNYLKKELCNLNKIYTCIDFFEIKYDISEIEGEIQVDFVMNILTKNFYDILNDSNF